MSLAAVPPLRVTLPYDLQTPIAAWLDDDDEAAAASAVYNGSVVGGGGGNAAPPAVAAAAGPRNNRNKPHFRSREVSHDLAKLQRLRTTIVDVLEQCQPPQHQQQHQHQRQHHQASTSTTSTTRQYDEAAAQLDTFYEYHASLLQCEQHGICVDALSSPLELPWASAFVVYTVPPVAAVARAASRNHDDDDDDNDDDDDDDPMTGTTPSSGRGRYKNHPHSQQHPSSNNNNNNSNMEVHASIRWERINILWNIVALESYLASTQPLTTKQGWMKAAVHLEKGAGIVRYLRNDVLPLHFHVDPPPSTQPQQQQQYGGNATGGGGAAAASSTSTAPTADLSIPFLQSWEALLTAEAQRSSFEAFRCAPRPRHFMLAKLATAAAPLYAECDQSCRRSYSNINNSNSISYNNNNNERDLHAFLTRWEIYARSWGVWMRTKGEHHQAGVHRDKRQLGLELARLQKAIALGGQCQELCRPPHQQQQQKHHQQQGIVVEELELLANEANQTVEEMQGRYAQASQEQAQAMANANSDGAGGRNNSSISHAPVPPDELPDIAPQLQVKVNQPLEKILPPLETPLFEDIMNPMVRRYVDLFMTEMDKLLFQMTSIAEEKTESARKALAMVNLPHSLTAYRQEQAGGGIPEDLWFRVEAVQREKRVARLKQELWELRDIADSARHTYKVIKHQLEEDLAMDQLFREQHTSFQGHDAAEVQKTFRQSLENYDRLLVTAQDGDAVLLRRLEMLDTDPKYKLLQFQKSQLDRLLPGAGMVGPAIDTSMLSKLLVELSVLFREREMILSTMREELKNFDIHSRLCEADLSASAAAASNNANNAGEPNQALLNQSSNPEVERDFRRILVESKESFNEIAYDIQENINKQAELVQTILVQNQKFMDARDAMQSSSSSDSCIVMIEDAIEEIEQLSKHLKEGKDFYDVVIPKLDKLKLQVGDVSARLTVERCEYEDNCRRNEQEAEDARMAASFAGNNDGNGGGGGGGGNSNSGSGGGGQSASSGGGSGVSSHDAGRSGSVNMPMGETEAGLRRGSDVAPRAQAQPGAEQVSHSQPQVRVDDEKVASLIAMDFDPEKVVEALKKYDNNVEQALNELLSC